MSKDIFERLSAGRPPATEETIKQSSRRREDPKIFLKDILANGPAPANLVIERGAERGFQQKTNHLRPRADESRCPQRARKGRLLVLGSPPR